MDSPLSIAGNIAGLLTFAAAIAAFVYVRYRMFLDAEQEVEKVMSSTFESMVDAMELVAGMPGDSSAAVQARGLARQLLRVEVEIGNLVFWPRVPSHLRTRFKLDAMSFVRTFAENEEGDPETSRLRDELFVRMVTNAQQFPPDPFHPDSSSYVLYFVPLFLMPIILPASWQWYKAREAVLALTQKRESLRSRLFFHMVLAANTKTDTVSKLTNKLDDLNKKVDSLATTLAESSEKILESLRELEQHPGTSELQRDKNAYEPDRGQDYSDIVEHGPSSPLAANLQDREPQE